MNTKKLVAIILCVVLAFSVMLAPCMCLAADEGEDISDTSSEFDKVAEPIVDLIGSMLNVVLAFVGAVGAIYCVFLGIKFAKAEEPQDKEKAKDHLKNAIIGFVLIFVLILGLRLLMPVMTKWVSANSKKA